MGSRWFEFRVPGKIEWSQPKRDELASKKNASAAVCRLFIYEDSGSERGVVVVFNKACSNPDGSVKDACWGLPTETVDLDETGMQKETPLSTAEDVGRREINLSGKTVQVSGKPILVNTTRNSNGQILTHFLFNASLEPFTDIPKEIKDEDGEVTRAIILDPNKIEVPPEGIEGKPFFMLDGEKQEIYPSHVGYIAWGYKSMTRTR